MRQLVAILAALGFQVASPALATFEGLNGPIVYQVTRSGFGNISAGKVTPGESPTSLGLSGLGYKVDMYYAPDGERVVYTVYDPTNTTISSLRIQNIVQGGGSVLGIPPVQTTAVINGESYTTDWYPRHPSFTADGRGVVFSQAGHIRLYDLDTDAITDLTAGGIPTSRGDYYWPTVSSDGTMVAFQMLTGSAIGVMPITGGGFSSIGAGLVIPTWHPTKLEILAVDVDFSSHTRTFYALTPAGVATPVHTAPGSSVGGDSDLGRFRAVWSPEGDKIAYTVLNEDAGLGAYGNALYTYEVGGSDPPEIVATMPSSSGNVWHAVRPTWGAKAAVDLTVDVVSPVTDVGDDFEVRYDISVSNLGPADASAARIEIRLPDQVKYVSSSALGAPCEENGVRTGGPDDPIETRKIFPAGGFLVCNVDVPGNGSVLIQIETEVTNSADLGRERTDVDLASDARPYWSLFVEANPKAPGSTRLLESDYTNNSQEKVLAVQPLLSPGSTADTLQLLSSGVGAGFFEAETSDESCTGYQRELLARLNALRGDGSGLPGLSYGPVTDEGHNGVVVYETGTNYRNTGVVLHGTAAPSQYSVLFPTAWTDDYFATPIQDWQQGSGAGITPLAADKDVHQNAGTEGMYFEGVYPGDSEPVDAGLSMVGFCAAAPNATGVSTGSPVELRITNSVGQQIRTNGSRIVANELSENFFAYKFFDPSNDTVDWDMVLPPDRYVVEIIGIKTGPYTLTLRTYDDDGEVVEVVHQGTAQTNRSETFVTALAECPPNAVDSDSDGVCNGVDNCPLDPNGDQADGDSDGFGDVCDSCTGADTDADGVCDDVDNCPDDYNPTQYDEEEDGLGEACDPCPLDEINDPDQDGLCAYDYECDSGEPEFCDPEFEECCDPEFEECCDPEFEFCPELSCEDNCPLVSNPDQFDSDFDLVGDVCDPCPFDPFDACPGAQDSDSDGIYDAVDNCPADPNPDQADADGDGLGDVCDSETCGDGVIEGGEECDDGALASGDGCSATCGIESGYVCGGEPSTCTSAASPLDPFLVYKVKRTKGAPKSFAFGPVQLTDQFRSAAYRIDKPLGLAVPASTNGDGIGDPVTHLLQYLVKPMKGETKFDGLSGVRISNPCSDLLVEVGKPTSLLVPATVGLSQPVTAPDDATHDVDHFLCYQAKAQTKLEDGTKLPKFPKGIQVEVSDAFQTRRYDLKKITRLCNPVDKSGSPAYLAGPNKGEPKPIAPASRRNPEDHLVCYLAKQAKKAIEQDGCGPAPSDEPAPKIDPAPEKHQRIEGLYVASQLGEDQLDTIKETELCLRSEKLLP